MDGSTSLAVSFLEAIPPSLQAKLATLPDLERELLDVLSRCRATWSEFCLSDAVFLAYLAKRMPADTQDLFSAWHVTDLYLACACCESDPKALAVFETRFHSAVDAALARLRLTPEQVKEVKQALRIRLLVGTQCAGRLIATYAGTGPLSGWIRIAAARAAYTLMQRQRPTETDEEELLAALPSMHDSPELEYLQTKYSGELYQAFTTAMGSLDSRARIVLRLHFVDGLCFDSIGTVLQVHPTTISRWINKAVDSIFSDTRRALMRQLHIRDEECDSVLRLARGQLQVSLSGFLPPVDSTALSRQRKRS
jgi:RNA polymerase sigma-70 factor, ECF subfamily